MYFEGLGMSNAIDLVAGYNAMTQNGSPTGAVFLMQANSSITLKYAKFEPGKIATPYIPRLIAEETMLCQRYYYNGYITLPMMNSYKAWYEFPVTMRATPAVTFRDVHYGTRSGDAKTSLSTNASNGVYHSDTTRYHIGFVQNYYDGLIIFKASVERDAEIR